MSQQFGHSSDAFLAWMFASLLCLATYNPSVMFSSDITTSLDSSHWVNSQVNIETKYNPHQNLSYIICRNLQTNPKIFIEMQKIQNSQKFG